ncbi:hypothetical protein [Vibrio proteolyticus]|uniref:Uncharacterized protein n=1 Tax=Vibrio proteolyticus NBRC 13287 TaxID=1219065 RepID=U3A585_VIBPR|nr:hypothetical protein [Vibrio proteolyticus]GAD68845.1 hypothetical protein VPR01S_20_00250 [Vibrio proteolyticus NBRC 13287]
MKMLMVAIMAALSASPVHASEESDQTDDLKLMLISAKMHGACGLVHQMANFQNSTQLAGGDEFISRFVATELARLNMTGEEFLSSCDKAASYYKYYMNLMETTSN